MPVTAEEIRSLSVEERLDLIDLIWDSLAEEPSRVPVTDGQRAELDRRIQSYRQKPGAVASWNEVRARLKL